jgi:hypothetical protein
MYEELGLLVEQLSCFSVFFPLSLEPPATYTVDVRTALDLDLIHKPGS